MRCRKEERFRLRLRTVVTGIDRRGKVFRESAETLDFSTFGARLSGLNSELEPGSIVSLTQGDRCANFQVTWVGDPRTQTEGQIGLRCVEVAAKTTKRILAVEAAGHEQRARASLLSTDGYEVVTTDKAVTAWELLLENRYELMLIDFPLPDSEAVEVAKAVREYWPNMRIVISTARPGSMPETLLSTVDDWVHKGAPGAELLGRVAKLIGSSSGVKWPLARSTRRYAVDTEVDLRIFRSGTATLIQGRSIDLSVSGIGVTIEEHVLPGELATAYFELPDPARTRISARVMVRRTKGNYCGMEFIDIAHSDATAIERACEALPLVNTPVPQ